jgi:hypothetical protein
MAFEHMGEMPMRMEDAPQLRVSNIKDPVQPAESGWLVPPDPDKKNAGPLPKDLVTHTEDVLGDTRGYVYVTDRTWGVWILRQRGPDQPAPTDW